MWSVRTAGLSPIPTSAWCCARPIVGVCRRSPRPGPACAGMPLAKLSSDCHELRLRAGADRFRAGAEARLDPFLSSCRCARRWRRFMPRCGGRRGRRCLRLGAGGGGRGLARPAHGRADRDWELGPSGWAQANAASRSRFYTGDWIETLADPFYDMGPARPRNRTIPWKATVDARTEELRVRERERSDARLAAEQALAQLHQAQDRLLTRPRSSPRLAS